MKKAYQITSGILIFLSLIWAVAFWGFLFNRVYTLWNIQGFKKADFHIKSVRFYEGSGSSSNKNIVRIPHGEAEGQINGKGPIERLSLLGYFKEPPKNQAELENKISVPSKTEVLFNPDISLFMQGESLRIRKYDPNFKMNEIRQLFKYLSFALCPFISLYLLSTLVGRRLRAKKE